MAVQRRTRKASPAYGHHPFIVVSEWSSVTGREYLAFWPRDNRGNLTRVRAIVLIDPIDIERARAYFGKWRALRAYVGGKMGLNSPDCRALPE